MKIGFTGPPGAGKSALAREIASRCGGSIIDADIEGHEIIKCPAIRHELVRTFGGKIIGSGGLIDRSVLGAIVFPDRVSELNLIVHPELRVRLITLMRQATGFTILDCALLHELGLGHECDWTVYVDAPFHIRAARAACRKTGTRLGADDLSKREVALGNAENRKRCCDFVVDTVGPTDELASVLIKRLGLA